jgi:hypothetical protein
MKLCRTATRSGSNAPDDFCALIELDDNFFLPQKGSAAATAAATAAAAAAVSDTQQHIYKRAK